MKIRPITFPIENSFPPSDPLAIDILRLMAGYNDLALIIEWQEDYLKEPPDTNDKTWAAGRLDMQLRLLYSVMHETLNVLQDIQKQPDFPKLERRLDSNGRDALNSLQQIRNGQDELGRKFLTLSRNKTAYHYDHNQFKDGLKRLIDRFGRDCTGNLFFMEHKSGREQYYFPLADMIRAEITQGLTGAANKEYLDKLLALTRSFGIFMESLLIAYASERGLKLDFSFKK